MPLIFAIDVSDCKNGVLFCVLFLNLFEPVFNVLFDFIMDGAGLG